MAHRNEIRDAWYVEQFRTLSFVPKHLIDRFEVTGDIADLANVIDFLRSCNSQKQSECISAALPKE